jgi:hypothetical protein
MSTTQRKKMRCNISVDINQTLQNQHNLVFRERRNNKSTKTSNSKQVEGGIWQVGYKPVEMTSKNKTRDVIATCVDTLVLFFFSTNIVSNAKIKTSSNQKSTNSAVQEILKRSNGTETSYYDMSKCSELRKSIYFIDTRLMYKHSVESRISESQAVNMLAFAR